MTEYIFRKNKKQIMNQAVNYYNQLNEDELIACADIMAHIFGYTLMESITQGIVGKDKSMRIAHSVAAAFAVASSLEGDNIHTRLEWMKTNLDEFQEKATRVAISNVNLMNEIHAMVDNNWEDMMDECLRGASAKTDYRSGLAAALMIKAAFANNVEVNDPRKNTFQPLLDWLENANSDMDFG